MRTPILAAFVCGLSALFLLAGCSSGSSSTPTADGISSADKEAATAIASATADEIEAVDAAVDAADAGVGPIGLVEVIIEDAEVGIAAALGRAGVSWSPESKRIDASSLASAQAVDYPVSINQRITISETFDIDAGGNPVPATEGGDLSITGSLHATGTLYETNGTMSVSMNMTISALREFVSPEGQTITPDSTFKVTGSFSDTWDDVADTSEWDFNATATLTDWTASWTDAGTDKSVTIGLATLTMAGDGTDDPVDGVLESVSATYRLDDSTITIDGTPYSFALDGEGEGTGEDYYDLDMEWYITLDGTTYGAFTSDELAALAAAG